jgi:tetratricopeptide (TPR) repeat protein
MMTQLTQTVWKNVPCFGVREYLACFMVFPLALLLLITAPVMAASDKSAMEKKLRLVQHYLNSKTADKIESAGNPEAQDLLSRSRELAELAEKALKSGELSDAENAITQALQSFSSASAAMRRGKDSQVVVQKKNEQLLLEIKDYRASFLSSLKDKGPAFANLLDIPRLESLIGQASTLGEQGKHRQAHDVLQSAYQMTVTAVTRLRDNETLVYALEFRTPADEYRYELNRYQSYEILVQQMRDSGKDQGSVGKMVLKFVDKAKELKKRAADEATTGDFEKAIKTMEEANRSLGRALQMMGLPIPG